MSTTCTLPPAAEPWMRGTHMDVPAPGRAVLHALELCLEDTTRALQGISDDELHDKPFGLSSLAFHLRHIARSTDRLLTYAEGHPLTTGQLAALKTEADNTGTVAELTAALHSAIAQATNRVRLLSATDLEAPRAIGRKQLPTTVGGAMIHVADHVQRHTGQIVTTAKLLRALRS